MRDARPTVGRRTVLLGGAAAAGWALVGPTLPAWGRSASASRGSAAPAATNAARARFTSTMEAYASTLVPGKLDDPAGAAGAYEAGGVQVLQAQLPEVAPVVIADVEVAAVLTHLRPFTSLTYAQRQALLMKLFADPLQSTPHLIAFALVAGSYYGDMVNHVGSKQMGLPGPSTGHLATYTDRTGHGQPQRAAIPA